jgi:uncharacterized Fe-S radical SAM superfamily protein PflX
MPHEDAKYIREAWQAKQVNQRPMADIATKCLGLKTHLVFAIMVRLLRLPQKLEACTLLDMHRAFIYVLGVAPS